MTATIQRRVEALESAGAAGIDFMLILRHIITPGVQPGEAMHAQVLGQSLNREPAETEAQFIDRIHTYALAHHYDPKTGAAFTWAVTKGRHLYGEDAAELDLVLTIDDGVARWAFKEAEVSSAERILALADEGLTAPMIAEELGIHRTTVWRALKKAGKQPPKPGAAVRDDAEMH